MADPAAPLLPPPAVVRDQLARTIRQADLLRSLLRLSVRAAKEHRTAPTAGTEPEDPADRAA